MDARIGSRLRTLEGRSIPLRAVDLAGELIGGQLRVQHRQRYENSAHEPVEAIYSFPIPSEASVIGFAMECAGRRLQSKLAPREEAFEAYHDATLAGHGAALLERERSNVFTASVGNLLPGETLSIELEYIQRLRADEGALRVVLPTLVAPRYVPGRPGGPRTAHGVAEPTDLVPDADRISPASGSPDYSVSLDLTLHGTQLTVSSPSHELETRAIDDGLRVSFAQGRVALDRDVVIAVAAEDGAELSSVVAHKQGKAGHVAVSYVPDLGGEAGAARTNLDVAFVLDRSGSMAGSSLTEAVKALKLCLRQLCEGDRFSISTFAGEWCAFKPELAPFTQRTLDQADAWIDEISAGGGTEMLAPLLAAVELVNGSGNGCVVLLSDGQVGDEQHILKQVLARAEDTRVYTFGIGSNVSDELLLQLARETEGAAEFIHPGERVDEKVVATFARAIAPRVRGLCVDWQDVHVSDLAPAEPPPLVDGEPWVWLGRYEQPGHGALRLRGTLRGQPWSMRIPVLLSETAQAPLLPKLWAAERIRDLEAKQLEQGGAALEGRITALAIEFGIASSHTSFIVIETREQDRLARQPAAARPIPVHAPAGWGMFAELAPPSYAVASFLPMPVPDRRAPTLLAGSPRELRAQHVWDSSPPLARALSVRASATETGAPRAIAPEAAAARAGTLHRAPPAFRARVGADPAFEILSRQLASGLWDDAAGAGDAQQRQLEASARGLIALLRLGIDAGHAQYGALIRKAIAELLPLAAALAPRLPELAQRAFALAWLSSTGPRTRRAIRSAIERAGLAGLAARLADEAGLRAHVLEASD